MEAEVLVLVGREDQEASWGVLVEVVQEGQMVGQMAGHYEGHCKGSHWQLDLEMVSSDWVLAWDPESCRRSAGSTQPC